MISAIAGTQKRNASKTRRFVGKKKIRKGKKCSVIKEYAKALLPRIPNTTYSRHIPKTIANIAPTFNQKTAALLGLITSMLGSAIREVKV